MAQYNPHERYSDDVHQAAAQWREECLLGSGSIFSSDKQLWTKPLLDELDEHYVRNLDEGDGSFLEKLDTQLAGGSAPCKQLMAEVAWLLLLFPSRISPPKKRQNITQIWDWSGEPLPTDHPLLSDAALNGLGHAGTAYNTHKWREFVFAINALREFKSKSVEDQKALANDPWKFASWLTTMPDGSNRQLRHILLHLMFPDDFERISTAKDKHTILASFENVPISDVRKREIGDIDRALKALRESLEAELGSPIDFYQEGIVERWKPLPDDSSVAPQANDGNTQAVRRKHIGSQALNTILYGPPGTGKTYETAKRAVLICDGHAPAKRKEVMARYEKLYEEQRIEFVTFHQSYSYEEFIEGLRPVTGVSEGDTSTQQSAGFRLEARAGVLRRIAERASQHQASSDQDATDDKPGSAYVLIIDEINRANISKVLGELITLLEDDKRASALNQLTVTLPYSGKQFSLPGNLYVLGTMNTADRSIALLDTALRRRFRFEEMSPRPDLLSDIVIDGIGLDSVLEAINNRLEWYLGSDHLIGHGYFTDVSDIEQLDDVITGKIIPLLREYFHEDLSRVRVILGGGDAFIRRERIAAPHGMNETFEDERFRYVDVYSELGQYGKQAYDELLSSMSKQSD